jgi:arsenate reductase
VISSRAGSASAAWTAARLARSHFNPVVSFADAALGGLSWRDATAYLPAQVAGCVTGAVAANLMFSLSAVSISVKHRASGAHALSEVIATAGLVLVIFALARSGRLASAPAAVGAYIGAAYWFTSSTSFANPAIDVGRMFSNTFAGIAPSSVPVFVAAQIGGGIAGVAIIRILYPALTPAEAAGSSSRTTASMARNWRGSPRPTATEMAGARRPGLAGNHDANGKQEVIMHMVAIGGSDAGISAALRAREVDPGAEVTVVAADAYPNFSICGIPYYVSGEVPHWRNLAHRTIADLEAAGMGLRLDTTARSIDTAGRKLLVTGPDGAEDLIAHDQPSVRRHPGREDLRPGRRPDRPARPRGQDGRVRPGHHRRRGGRPQGLLPGQPPHPHAVHRRPRLRTAPRRAAVGAQRRRDRQARRHRRRRDLPRHDRR